MIDRTEAEIMKNWQGDISKPLVSVCCITYNHEKYISEAIDSFLMQETTFPFEIVIDEDCSTDNTAHIIREYANKYPNIINAKLRNKNVGMIKNGLVNLKRANGIYIALCEGDDYWTDPLKLQKQFDALEMHKECSFSGHDVKLVTSDNKFLHLHSKGRISENWDTGIKNNLETMSAVFSVPHTSAMFFRKKHLDYEYYNKTETKLGGDYRLFVLFCSKGHLYYIDEVMSAYRLHNTSTSASWNYANNEEFFNEVVRSHNIIDEYFNYSYSKEIACHLNGQYMMKYEQQLSKSIDYLDFKGIIVNLMRMFKHSKNSQYTKRDILWLFRQKLKKRILDKQTDEKE